MGQEQSGDAQQPGPVAEHRSQKRLLPTLQVGPGVSKKLAWGGSSTSVYQGGRPQHAFQALRGYRENSQQNQQPLSCSSGTDPILYLPRVKVTGQQHRDLCFRGQWPHHPRYQAFSFKMLSQLGTPRTRDVEARGGRV